MTRYQERLVRIFERHLANETEPPVDLTAAILGEGLDPDGLEKSYRNAYVTGAITAS